MDNTSETPTTNTNHSDSSHDPFGGDIVKEEREIPRAISREPVSHFRIPSTSEESTSSESEMEEPEGSGFFRKLEPKQAAASQPEMQQALALLQQTIELQNRQKSNHRTIVFSMLLGVFILLVGFVGILYALGVFDKASVPNTTIALAQPTQVTNTQPPNSVGAQNQPNTPTNTTEEPPKNLANNVAPKAPSNADVTASKTTTPTVPTTPTESKPLTETTTPPKKSSSCLELGLCPEPEKAPVAPTPPAPQVASGLTPEQIKQVMGGASFKGCKTISTGKVALKITVASSGKVTNVQTDGSPLAGCVAGLVKQLNFPIFSDPSYTFSQSVTVKD